MLLRHTFDLEEEAKVIETAVSNVLKAGYRTGDIMQDGMTQLGCSEMGDKVLEAL
jgi:3-isopropylmalate dehydrogenase